MKSRWGTLMTMVAAATEVKYRDIARRLIAKESPADIAKSLELSSGTLYWHMRQASFRAVLRELDMQVFQEIDQLLGEGGLEITQQISGKQDEAFEKVIHLMRYGRKEGIQLRAAQDVLDRGGSTAPKRIDFHAKIELRETSMKFLLHAFKETSVLDAEDADAS